MGLGLHGVEAGRGGPVRGVADNRSSVIPLVVMGDKGPATAP